MQWILYLLAKHNEVQNRLIETKNEEYNNLLKGIVKEALRLYPVAPFLTRILQQDISVGGYRVPNGVRFILLKFQLYILINIILDFSNHVTILKQSKCKIFPATGNVLAGKMASERSPGVHCSIWPS